MSTTAYTSLATSLDICDDIEVDFNVPVDAYDDDMDWELDLCPSATTSEVISARDEYDSQAIYMDDVILVYMNSRFLCSTAVLRQGSGAFKKLLEDYTPDSFDVRLGFECPPLYLSTHHC
jgi:hypothetical protein